MTAKKPPPPLPPPPPPPQQQQQTGNNVSSEIGIKGKLLGMRTKRIIFKKKSKREKKEKN